MHDGLLEYEVVDDGRELALTLLRATGYLSRSEPSLRPNPAGPLDPLEGPQLQGRARARLRGAPAPRRLARRADCYAAADDVLVPLERVRGGGWPGRRRRATGSALDVDGAEVSAVLRDDAGALVVRVVQPHAGGDRGHAWRRRRRARSSGDVVDLTGDRLERLRGRRRAPTVGARSRSALADV